MVPSLSKSVKEILDTDAEEGCPENILTATKEYPDIGTYNADLFTVKNPLPTDKGCLKSVLFIKKFSSSYLSKKIILGCFKP